MTGSLYEKKHKSGNAYWYVRLSYKDPVTQQWKQKDVATHLPSKGNKKKAAAMVDRLVVENAALEEDKSTKSPLDAEHIKLSDYALQWLEEGKRGWEISTYEGYACRVAKIVDYFSQSELELKQVTPRDIDLFMKYLLNEGKINQKTHEREPMAVRSARAVKSILFSVFTQAAVDGLVNYNPAAAVKVRGKKDYEYAEEMLFLTEEECKAFLEFLSSPEHPEMNRFAAMAFFGIFYGLRRSELLGLKWSAVLEDQRKLRIEHTVTRVRTYVAKDRTKTFNSFRELALVDAAIESLHRIREEQEREKAYWGSSYRNTEDYVFTWEDGSRYDPDYISKAFVKAARKFGKPSITYHKLRHTCASLLIARGWDVKKVQYWLGHADIKTTLKIYAHFDRQKLNADPEDLAELTRRCLEIG